MGSTEVVSRLLDDHAELAGTAPDLIRLCVKLEEVFRAGGTLFIAGNGGSAADAQHIAAELMKSFERRRPLADGL